MLTLPQEKQRTGIIMLLVGAFADDYLLEVAEGTLNWEDKKESLPPCKQNKRADKTTHGSFVLDLLVKTTK